MKFKNKRTRNQKIAITGIAISIFIAFILPSNEHFLIYLKIYGITAIFCFTIIYWGETVRKHIILNPYRKNEYASKAEETIANYFKKKGIIYRHTPEISCEKSIGPFLNPFATIKLHPDFFLPEFDIFVEYWGLMSKADYKKKHDLKVELYKKNKIDLINLYPSNLANLDADFTEKFINLMKEREGVTKIYEN